MRRNACKDFFDLSRSQQWRVLRRELAEEDEIDEAEPDSFLNLSLMNEYDAIPHTQVEEIQTERQLSPEIDLPEAADCEDVDSCIGHFSASPSYSDTDFDRDEDPHGSSDDEDEIFLAGLQDIALTHLPDYVTNKLLKILRDTKRFQHLPPNHKQLLGSLEHLPKPVQVSGGQFLYLGVKSNLEYLKNIPIPDTITLDFSWDGVALFKSSANEMWPIVMHAVNVPESEIMLIGVFIGKKSRMKVEEFFYCLNEELKDIRNAGNIIQIGEKTVEIQGRCFVCDTPARNFALGKTFVCDFYFLSLLLVHLSFFPMYRRLQSSDFHFHAQKSVHNTS